MKMLRRLLIAVLFALLVTAGTYLIAQARVETNDPAPQQQQLDCFMCHPKFNDAWTAGAHGHAMDDPKFNQMWTDQGKPGACLVCHVTDYDPAAGTWKKDGVACEACHNPIPVGHSADPTSNPVPVYRTSDLCGRCHSDERFGLQEWQSSTHFQRAMTCTVCHDPHAATLKTVQGLEEKGSSGLCINCHSEVSMNFPYSKHNQAGVNCVDCHLRHFEDRSNDVHAMPDHSFNASLATCNACHADQMHTTIGDTEGAQTTTGLPTITTPSANAVGDKPAPVSPAGFAGLAGLLGIAGGMVLQPWLEKAYQQMNKKGSKK